MTKRHKILLIQSLFIGTSTRRGRSTWQVGLFLLPGPDIQKLPSLSDRHVLTNNGLGLSFTFKLWDGSL